MLEKNLSFPSINNNDLNDVEDKNNTMTPCGSNLTLEKLIDIFMTFTKKSQ